MSKKKSANKGPRLVGEMFFFSDWTMPDPDSGALADAVWTAAWQPENLTARHRNALCCATEAYRHLAGHVATNKMVLDQLRQLRAAVRANRRER